MYCIFTLVLIVFSVEAGKYGAYRRKGLKHQYRYENIRSNDEVNNCSSVYCPHPDRPLNGQVSLVDTKIGYSATFICDQNSTMCGTDKITCGYDGEWDKNVPVCVKPFIRNVDNLTVTYGDTVYYFSNEAKPFSDAQVFCENLGGNLLSINSKAEWDFIKCVSLEDHRGLNARWIGLINNNGTWEWTNGQPVTESYWHSVDSNHGCAVRYVSSSNFEWLSTSHCSASINFICEMNGA